MKKAILWVLCIMILSTVAYNAKLYIEKRHAVDLAKEYLDNKYSEKMIFRNVAKFSPLVNPGNFSVIFYPEGQPELSFDISVDSFGKSDKFKLKDILDLENRDMLLSCDSYLLKKFQREMNDCLEDLDTYNGTTLSSLAVHNTKGIYYNVPKSLSEETDFIVAEQLIDYIIYVKGNLNLSNEQLAEEVISIFEQLNNYGFSPSKVILCLENGKSTMYVDFPDWSSIKYREIFNRLKNQGIK